MPSYLPVCPGNLSFPGNVPSCDQPWVVLDTAQDLSNTIATLISALNDLFSFDADLMSMLIIEMLLSWVAGHLLGRMMQAWRKVM